MYVQMDPMGSIPDFLKKKMVNTKPMVLNSLRDILKKQQTTDADATTSPATLEGESLVMNSIVCQKIFGVNGVWEK